MADLAFGRYTPYNTPVHKLDPRVKLFAMICLMVMIFLPFTLWSTRIILSGIYLLGFLIIMMISRVSLLELLKSLKGMWLMMFFLLAVYIFIPNSSYSGAIAFSIGTYKVYWAAFYQAAYIILRIVIMITLTMILTSTTKPMDLTFAFSWFMAPLKLIKFPVNEIAMTISIALRFIPTLLEETQRLMKAQESRGVDFKHNIFKKFAAIISLIIPLFVSSFQRSEDLANALEARGYDPKAERTRYRNYKIRLIDILSILLCVLALGGIITLVVFDGMLPNHISFFGLNF